MSRITEIEIAGIKYPLNFSVKAAKEVAEKYGNIANVGDAFIDKPMAEMMDEAIWLLSLLIEQGIVFKRITEGEEIKGVTADELEVLMGVSDFADIKNTLFGALTSGMKREVEIETEQKNAKTTQGK